MTVDVIIPVYNQLDLVRQCLDSVLKSTCVTDFEVVVFDDASPDRRIGRFLRELASKKVIQLVTNPRNLGFTRTVNAAMSLHKDRDVLLLNSDTLVYGAWLDRIVAAAYSAPRIATVNPLTNQAGSHISCYPNVYGANEINLESSDELLNDWTADVNAARYVDVHMTVGFCMFIRRDCLDEIGYFDATHFPVGYGEESDFCYRARKVGWRHLIAGDAFVTHVGGKSFGKAKIRLMEEMSSKFARLHPDGTSLDAKFRRQDPVHLLRANLDLARLKHVLSGRRTIPVHMEGDTSTPVTPSDDVYLMYSRDDKNLRFGLRDRSELFPNLTRYAIPFDLAKFNAAMRYLDVESLLCASQPCLSELERNVKGLPFEVTMAPRLLMAT